MSGKVRVVSNSEILKLLDVSTGKCNLCRNPARVPEDVVAVFTDMTPFIVCEECSPGFESMVTTLLHLGEESA